MSDICQLNNYGSQFMYCIAKVQKYSMQSHKSGLSQPNYTSQLGQPCYSCSGMLNHVKSDIATAL